VFPIKDLFTRENQILPSTHNNTTISNRDTENGTHTHTFFVLEMVIQKWTKNFKRGMQKKTEDKTPLS